MNIYEKETAAFLAKLSDMTVVYRILAGFFILCLFALYGLYTIITGI